MKLNKKQTKAIDYLEDKTTNELIFGGGAGGSKSVLGCYWILKMCLKYPNTRWVIGRASLKTLKETTLNTMFWVMQQQGVKPKYHYNFNAQSNTMKFFNGSEILFKDLALYPSDPNFDELGSLEITGAFVDECNQIVYKAWQILKSRIRYLLDEYGLVPKILGTCNPAKNWTYTEFFAPNKRNELKNNKKFIQALIGDNPDISKHYRDNLLTLDKSSKERLLYGNWEYDDDPATLCGFDAINDCFTNDHVKTGQKYISADLAMQGRDLFVAGSWDGLICTVEISKSKSTGKEIETDIKELSIRKSVGHSKIIADSDGLGAFLGSYLQGIKEFHGGATAIDKQYFNLKSECGFKLAELINKREIKIICSDEEKIKIIEELGLLKMDKVDADDQRKRIIKKDKMKEILQRSPDYLDMLLMRMYFEVKKELFGI